MMAQMAVFTKSTKVKCPKCEHEWYTFRFDDICLECEYYLNTKEFESCIIGEGTAEDVSSQEIPKWPKWYERWLKGQPKETHRRVRPGEINSEAVKKALEKYRQAVRDDYESGRMQPNSLTPEERMRPLD